MKKSIILTLCAVLALAVVGGFTVSLASAQTAINSSKVDKLEPMKSKKKDVIALFGQPHKTMKIGNEEVLVYQVSRKDPVGGKDTCDLLTVTIGWGDFVTSVVYKKYCEM